MLKVFLLALLLGVAVVAYHAYQGGNSAPANSAVVGTPPASPGAGTAAQATATPYQKLAATVGASSTSGRKPVHMVLTESEITAKVQEMVSSGKAGNLQNVQVKLGSGVATITGTTSFGGMSVPVEATAQLGASHGLLSVDVTSIKAENVSLPAPVRDELIQQVKQATGLSDLQNIDVGIDVTSVQVQPGQVVIDGQTR